MKFIVTQILALLFLTLLFSCKNVPEKLSSEVKIGSENKIKYAKGFDIQHFKDYTKVTIKAPYQDSKETFEFILTHSKTTTNLNTIQTPIKTIVVTSTTHIPMLELLSVEANLVGFPNTNFVSSEKTRSLISKGQIKELGHEENINTELLLDLKPDVVIGFSMNSNNKMFEVIEKFGIPILLNGDWLEETPLGRAEWIKLFGVLFEKEKLADSIFNKIEKDYLEAKNIASKAHNKPTILSGGLFKDIWNLPAGESFAAVFFKDANTNYLWSDSKGKGSLSLNIENVFLKGKDAEIWVSPSFHTSLNNLREANAVYSEFKAFQSSEVYSYMNTKGETGGIIYFELSPTRPDLVLKDIIKIAHPELLPDYNFTFFKKFN
ncbi:ABC transporter substrate-binding protein [uncultured Lutibacter sp.]|uniref:ABC transporter substrate-binding protein n=1 Tax=uncultured Lutibacter sp. TaxID=437739 RepID=UPI00261876B4|nr:ABC transporter substrate-binding protein [uncultured Lutibacter sp.]